MQLGSEFDRKKVKVLLCGSHLHFSIITVQMAFTCHCSVRMSGVIPLFQHSAASFLSFIVILGKCAVLTALSPNNRAL